MFGRGQDYKGNRISPLQMAILVMVRKRPMYGYEVLKGLRDEFGEFWTPKTGSIYPALKRLSEHGLLISEDRDGTDYYSISPEGEAWVVQTLRKSPTDVRFITRYLDFMGRAGDDILAGTDEGRQDQSGRMPPHFKQIFDEGEVEEEERLNRLRRAREHIARHLAEIDEELKLIEQHQKEKEERRV